VEPGLQLGKLASGRGEPGQLNRVTTFGSSLVSGAMLLVGQVPPGAGDRPIVFRASMAPGTVQTPRFVPKHCRGCQVEPGLQLGKPASGRGGPGQLNRVTTFGSSLVSDAVLFVGQVLPGGGDWPMYCRVSMTCGTVQTARFVPKHCRGCQVEPGLQLGKPASGRRELGQFG
jgi:hypothetical protein